MLHQLKEEIKEKSFCFFVFFLRYSTYSCTDTLPLLQTPVVQRRSPGARARLQQEIIASSPGRSSLTPQSIIKVLTLPTCYNCKTH